MADNAMNLIIVTPEREVVREEVEELEIPGSEGYFGVLPGHAPLFSEVKVGEVAYRKGTRWTFLAVAWGFVEVQPDQVRILAETAERAHEIDVDRAMRAKQRAEEMISRGGEDVDYNQALVALERAIVRIQVSQKAHSRSEF
jgi:F-type H+-transporting ATPase subunit epsilon